ncbi:ABC transporter ATP-binding protein (plasmid) [Ketogulonicigenium vulgare Y25]|uniref:ABC transporter nucleotide binding/ATPase protein (Oligopeptide) n=1 Tax=Ketogulonicigenium vulgare (strain WSH-001) TaxID=759362 RepID=F9YBJ0_KETVW|nr:ABC transporter ATP-binding protein [Ketogulonicigenium vulgare]ADO44304.1 ABC transporter ATP-binding protein [Ketogulonicigenium vulgare Y25]AEM42742.1 ABC transporter nucleotide binding/ATPase protein (Oligopeptide) [Ketogulonicigenium vulgare WSH-001]ALJ82810.1 ABC transporter ATP-binding protein [Ketogulonicigenium vulgare]
MNDLALDLNGLTLSYRTKTGESRTILNDINLQIGAGEAVSLVGESGSGKTSLGMAVLGLLAPNASATYRSLTIGGEKITSWRDPLWRQILGNQLALVPQDPNVSLNPVRKIGAQMVENLILHRLATPPEARARAADLLDRVGIDRPLQRLNQFPHELSGGQQQRVLIAMAFSSNPKLIVADEPTSGLDVTVQRIVLDQLDKLRQEFNTAVLLITHDIGVAADRTDRSIVMQLGKMVEQGPVRQVLTRPSHAYTQALIAAAPALHGARRAPSAGLSPAAPGAALVQAQALTKRFGSHPVLHGVSLNIARHSTVAIVGESGSGKSTLARAITGLERIDSGILTFDGVPVPQQGHRALRQHFRRVQMVYQNPYSALDPRFTVAQSIAEPLANFDRPTRATLHRRTSEALDAVALPQSYLTRLPSELSGGERQRVAIARGLILRPDLLVLDEPVSALDVSVQGQILQLLVDLQAEFQLTYLFISHDLAVVRQISDEVHVLNQGRIVSSGPTAQVFDASTDPYTRRLLAAIPGQSLSGQSLDLERI